MDDAIPHEEYASPRAAPAPWYDRPWVIGLLGLALMVGGWKLSRFVPEGAVPEKVRELEQQTDDEQLRGRLRQIHGNPPYQVPGRLVFFAGLLVFVYAGAKMASGRGRDPSPQPPPLRGEGE
jgi:hypothetical protein